MSNKTREDVLREIVNELPFVQGVERCSIFDGVRDKIIVSLDVRVYNGHTTLKEALAIFDLCKRSIDSGLQSPAFILIDDTSRRYFSYNDVRIYWMETDLTHDKSQFWYFDVINQTWVTSKQVVS